MIAPLLLLLFFGFGNSDFRLVHRNGVITLVSDCYFSQETSNIFGDASSYYERRSGFARTESQAGQCATNCKNSSNSDVASSTEGETEVDPFDIYCRKANRTLDCVESCPSSEVKVRVTKEMEIQKYICRESNFRQHANCYQKVLMEDRIEDQICDSESKCGLKKAAHERLLGVESKTEQDFERLLRATCEYRKCYHECILPKMTEECGISGKKSYDDFLDKYFTVVHEYYAAMGINIALPNECKKVVDDSIDDE